MKGIRGFAIAAAIVAVAAASSVAYAEFGSKQTPTDWFAGHWHDEHGQAVDAPAHSGGTDAYGCHNGSVPYHCH